MRAVCFVKRFEFDMNGTIFPNALALDDVDNDGNNELVVGNMSGDLCLFKSDRMWQKITGLGMITALGIGDIFNIGSNALVAVGGDGWCHILFKAKQDDTADQKKGKLESVHVQRIPANTKVVLLGDIDGDGCTELVMGLTDRVVRSYRWVPDSNEPGSGKLIGLHKWECANQIGTVTLNHLPDGTPCLLVAQPGGTLMKIRCHSNEEMDPTNSEMLAPTSVEYHPLSCSRMRNPNVSTEIQGGIKMGSTDTSASSLYAVATLDGTLMLVQDENVVWSIQVDHQLFALTKLDMTGDGRDEIVACSWDGQTYILDQEKCSVRFQLEESVVSFCSGYYTLQPGQMPVPCLVYTTFTNKIYVYYDVQLTSMRAKTFSPKQLTAVEEDPRRAQLLMEWCLYGQR
ncbi:KICSTOR complex protein ITFG2-like isoform X1 [Periplaneta americana]|uniref:KICSTOR complex protein ITFG2-like isoform X1 n=1 Tax=Periplaneta americana TaxID=6978 RepID=UPI0037E93D51